MKVIIESPYAGNVQIHEAYLKNCVLDSIKRGEYPLASHGFYPQYLDDDNPSERMLGIKAGLKWATHCDKVVLYMDFGISEGMAYAMADHVQKGRSIEMRWLEPDQDLCFLVLKPDGSKEGFRGKMKEFIWGPLSKTDKRDRVILIAYSDIEKKEIRIALDQSEFRVSEYAYKLAKGFGKNIG